MSQDPPDPLEGDEDLESMVRSLRLQQEATSRGGEGETDVNEGNDRLSTGVEDQERQVDDVREGIDEEGVEVDQVEISVE